MTGTVIAFPRRAAPNPAEIFDAYGNVRVAPGRVLTCGQASVTLAQAAVGAAHGWVIEPDSEVEGRVIIARDLPHPSAGEPEALRCAGLSRDAEYPEPVSVVFSRPLTDDELRLFFRPEIEASPAVQEVAAQLPPAPPVEIDLFGAAR